MPAQQTRRLLLLDGHSLAYRAFYALPVENFSTSTGQVTNAVFGFTSMLINVLRDEQPTHIGVAFDVSRQTFRTEEFPDYKANRAKSPEEFAGQVDLVRQILTAMNIPSVSVEGFEADDIIATLAQQAEQDGFCVDIVTGDRDAFQLVNDDVTVLYPKRGVSDLARMTPSAVEEKYGLPPRLYADFAAIRGDKSDNLPNIPGVGEKTAAKWVTTYGGLQGVIEHAPRISGKVGQALRDHLDQVLTNRRLTELVRDVPLDITLDDLARRDVDTEAVHEIFDALEFQALRQRLFDTLDISTESESAQEVEISTKSVAEWLEAHGDKRVSLQVSGMWEAGHGSVQSLAMATDDAPVCWVDFSALSESTVDIQKFRQWAQSDTHLKVMHEAKQQILMLASVGIALRGVTLDTALAAYLLVPGQRSYDLPGLVSRFLGVELDGAPQVNEQMSLTGIDEHAQMQQAQAAAICLPLADKLTEELQHKELLALLKDVEMPTLRILADMELAGIAVDVEYLQDLDKQYAASIHDAEMAAWAEAGRQFNLGSPKQLQEILFVERGLPKTKKIKTGYTTDAEALLGLYAATEDPLLASILRFRDVSKLKQTVAGLLPLVDDHHRIHTTFNQMVASTGRLSSTDPNLQNIPIRTEEGRAIRHGFVVGDGYETLLTADYSQIELRIMAHLSEDAGLIEAFMSGEDLHNTVGSYVFDVPVDEVDPEMRRKVKAMSYGLAYGLSAYGLSQQLNISRDEAQSLMDQYFVRFGGVRDYLEGVVEQARATGWTETIMGRKRYLPDLTSDNRQRRGMAERMALNAPIQGSAADIVKVAMIRVHEQLAAHQLSSRMLLQVHDELVVEVAPGETEQVTDLVVDCMEHAADLTVPLSVSVGMGRTWEEAGH